MDHGDHGGGGMEDSDSEGCPMIMIVSKIHVNNTQIEHLLSND